MLPASRWTWARRKCTWPSRSSAIFSPTMSVLLVRITWSASSRRGSRTSSVATEGVRPPMPPAVHGTPCWSDSTNKCGTVYRDAGDAHCTSEQNSHTGQVSCAQRAPAAGVGVSSHASTCWTRMRSCVTSALRTSCSKSVRAARAVSSAVAASAAGATGASLAAVSCFVCSKDKCQGLMASRSGGRSSALSSGKAAE